MQVEKLRPTFTFDEDRLDALKQVVPEAFADGKINWEVLREALGDHLEAEEQSEEHFGLFWPGKREARRLASRPSKGTLVPVPGEGVNEETTKNLFIEGDNLEVLKLLQKSYAGRIGMIYIDPPFNTGTDLLYDDDYREPLESYLNRSGRIDEEGQLLSTNTNAGGRYHSKWLSMIYPRLRIARSLLKDEGTIFVSIDDNEAAHLRLLMNELFGEENFIAQFVWKARLNKDNRNVTGASIDHEYVLCYGNRIRGDERNLDQYSNPDNDPRGPWTSANMVGLQPEHKRPNLHYDLVDPNTGITYPKPEMGWRYDRSTMEMLIKEEKILWPSSPDGRPRRKKFLSELRDEYTGFSSIIGEDVYTKDGTAEIVDLFGEKIFSFPKPSALIRELIVQGSKENDIILDFFAGTGSTAQACWTLNQEDESSSRNFILIQIPESTEDDSTTSAAGFKYISQIAKERLRRYTGLLEEDGFIGDSGFRVYGLDRSNFKEWQSYDGTDVQEVQTLFDEFETPLRDGWQREDLLTEVLLMQGFPLSSTVKQLGSFTENEVLKVTTDFFDNRLFVCLDDTVAGATIGQLDLETEDIFVCLDSALSDEAKMRLADRCTLKVI